MAENIKETIELRLAESGFKEGAADVKALGLSEKQAADAAELLARAQTTVEKSLTRVHSKMAAYTASLDPAEKALKKLEQGEALVAAARSKGLTVTESMSRSVDLARERFERLRNESTGAAGALALTRNESLALTYTINDVVASLSTGASPMTILMQQGGQLTQAFGGVRGTFEKLLPVLARFAPLAAGAGAAFVAFEEVVGTYKELQKINEGAADAGVSTQLFQVWINYATRLRLTVEDAEKAISRAGQTLAGQVDNFSALGLDASPSRVAQRANNLSDVLGRDVASKGLAADATTLDDMHRAALQLVQDYLAAATELENHGRILDANQARAEAITAATEVWGDAGRRVAEALRDGDLTAGEFLTKGEDIGRVWSDEILEAQKNVSRELALASEHLSKSLNPATEELQKLTIGVLGAWARVVNKIADGVEWATRMVSALRQAGAGSQTARDAAGVGRFIAGTSTEGRIGRLIGLDGDSSDGRSVRDLMDEEIPLPPTRPDGLGKPAPKARAARAKKPKATRDELADYLKGLEKEIALLDAEAVALGKGNAEKARAVDLAKAEEIAKERGRPLSEAELARLTALADRHAALRLQVDERKKAEQAANEQMKFFGDAAYSAIERLVTGTGKLDDVLKGLVRSLEQAALKAVLLGEGPLASLFGGAGLPRAEKGAPGGLFGALLSGGLKMFPFAEGGMVTLAHLPSYAKGGALAPSGGFPILAHPGEIILNQAQQSNVAAGMRPRVAVHNYAAGVQVTPQVTRGEVALIVRSMVDQNNRRMPGLLADSGARQF